MRHFSGPTHAATAFTPQRILTASGHHLQLHAGLHVHIQHPSYTCIFLYSFEIRWFFFSFCYLRGFQEGPRKNENCSECFCGYACVVEIIHQSSVASRVGTGSDHGRHNSPCFVIPHPRLLCKLTPNLPPLAPPELALTTPFLK